MLVLTRKPGESVYIGEDIKVTLQGIRGNQARLGVDAPSNVRIYREEIYLQILEENQAAAQQSGPSDLGDIARVWKDKKQHTVAAIGKSRDSADSDDES